MKLIVNADDFGLTKAVNLGIIEAHEHGIVKSTTLMCNMEYTEHAVEISRSYKDLSIGIHLVLTKGKPLSDNVPSLINDKGEFLIEKNSLKNIDLDYVRKEFQTQIDKFLSFGITPSHIDSHHHVHLTEELFEIVEDLGVKYNIPIRVRNRQMLKNKNIVSPEVLIEEFYGDKNISTNSFINILNEYSNYDTVEVMSHPGYLDSDTLNISSYNVQRITELKTLTSNELKKFIKDNKIQVINFKDLI